LATSLDARWQRLGSQLCGLLRERKVCTAMFGVRVAPAHEEPRSGSNNSEHGSTSGHPTNFGSGRLIRVFRDIGRIFSLLLPSRPPVAHWSPAEKERSKPKTECGFVEGKKRFQLCFVPPLGVSFAKTRTPPVRSEVTPRAGSREPSCTGLGRLLEGST
jgi:hypothetical protein